MEDEVYPKCLQKNLNYIGAYKGVQVYYLHVFKVYIFIINRSDIM